MSLPRQASFLCVLTLLIACSSEQPRKSSASIVNGRATTASEFQNVVKLETRSSRGDTFSCTGTAIAPRIVLTARHCVRNTPLNEILPPARVRVIIGPDGFVGNTYQAVNITAAPGAWPPYPQLIQDGTDLALVEVDADLPFEPAVISFDHPNDLVGQVSTLVGYGQTPTNPGNNLRNVVMASATSVMCPPGSTCDVGFIIFGAVACSGDSGGPVLDAAGRVRGVGAFNFFTPGSTSIMCGDQSTAYQSVVPHRALIEGVLGIAPANDAGVVADASGSSDGAVARDASATPDASRPFGGSASSLCSVAVPRSTASKRLLFFATLCVSLLAFSARRRRGHEAPLPRA